MQKAKKRLLITGCALIAIALLLILYVVLIGTGVISGRQQSLIIQAGTAEKPYDGEALICEEWTLLHGQLKAGHQVVPIFRGSQLTPGQSVNQVTVRIEDENGVDVTEEYVIEYVDGILSVYTTELKIAANDLFKDYDGMPLTATSQDWQLESGALMLGHEIRATLTGTRTDVGTGESTVSVQVLDQEGKDVTHMYTIGYTAGTLNVSPRPITLTSGSAQKFYDNEPLAHGEVMLTGGSLLAGHWLDYSFHDSIVNVGSAANAFSVSVLDEEGRDVTSCYDVTTEFGQLTIDARPVTIRSASVKKKYVGDGVALTATSAQIVEGFIAPVHRLSCDFTGSQMEIGSSPNTFTVDILDRNGASVLSNYAVTMETGTLTVVEFVVDDGSSTDPDPALNSGINGGGAPDSDMAILNFQASVSGPIYLRLQSFGEYLNFGWELSPSVPAALGDYNPLSWIGSALAGQGEEIQHLELQWLVEPQGYLVPYYMNTLPVAGAEDSFIRVGTLTQMVDFYAYDLLAGLAQRQANLTPDPTFAEAEAAYREFVYANFLSIPSEELRVAMTDHIRRAQISPLSQTLIRDVASYIQGAAVYDLEAQDAPAGVDPILYFLNTSRRGVCRHYASAAVMMYRALGIPARYVVGYLGNSTANELSTVTGMQAHAWVEVYIDGLGWMPVEVTGGSLIEEEPQRIPIEVRPMDVHGLADGTQYSATEFRLFGDLLEGHEFVCTFEGTLSTPGKINSTIGSFSIINSLSGEDMTHLYEVITHPGVIEVVEDASQLENMEETLCLIIKPKDVSAIFNGQTLRANDWEYVMKTVDGELVVEGDRLKENHRLVCTYGGELSAPGTEVSTILSYQITDANTGEDVTEQYFLILREGSIEMSASERYIIIKPVDVKGTYTGEAYVPTDWEYAYGSDTLFEGHELVIHQMLGSQTNIGSSTSLILSCAIVDSYTGENVSELYTVVTQPGRIDVSVMISVKPVDVIQPFRGEEVFATDWEFLPESGSLMPDHELICTVNGSRWGEGTSESFLTDIRIVDTVSGEDVTDQYSITALTGFITVLPFEPLDLHIKPVDVEAMFDGQVHAPTEWEYMRGSERLADGHELICDFSGSMRFPIWPEGDFETDEDYFRATCQPTYIISAWVRDTNTGEDVSYMYNIISTEGYVTVMGLEFSIDPADMLVLYDGQIHEATRYTATELSSLHGDRNWLDQYRLEVSLSGRRTQYGKTPITVASVVVYSEAGEDVTAAFSIEKKEGLLHIYSDKLAFRTGSSEKAYDGKPLINTDWEHIGGSLMPGHTLSVETHSGLTAAGTAQNTPVFHITDASGADVSDWYMLDTARSRIGRITVHKMRLGIRSRDAQDFFAPDKVLTCHEFDIIEGSVAEGEWVDPHITGSQSKVGYSENTIRWENVRIYDEEGKDTTRNYDIYAISGILTMNPPN